METNFKRYWDDIRKTLIIYSIIPVLSLFLIGYPLQYYFFMSSIRTNNQQCNAKLAQSVEVSLEQQLCMVETIADTRDIQKFLSAPDEWSGNMSSLYETIYGQINACDLRSDCFVLDGEGNILLSTTNVTPGYLKASFFPYTSLALYMTWQPEESTVKWSGSTQAKEYTMYLGRAVEQEGQIIGFVVAVLPGDTLSRLVAQQENSAVRSVIVNPFGYPFAGNVEDWLLEYGKLHSDLRSGSGKVNLEGRIQYVDSCEILNNRVAVYTMTDIAYLDEIFVRIGILLLVVSALLTFLMLVASRRIARKKSNVLDNMLSAIKNVRKGNLSGRLVVDTGDEFQIFAEEYNRMLTELEKLMELNKEIGRRTAISEIKQLESQFNPHFLFNTLSSIRYMIDIDTGEAQKMIASLCKLLRYSIKTVDSQTTLEEDWQYTQQYLSILKCRFGDRLSCRTQIAPETMDCLVPKLLFQPIIENAVTYGFGDKEVLHLEIQASLCQDILMMTITNDGEAIAPDRLREIQARLHGKDTSGRSIGLYNIHRRIQLLYGEAYGVALESSTENGTIVRIRFPAQRGNKDDSSSNCGR